MCLLKKTDNFEDCDHPDYIELFKLLNSHITNPTQRSTLEISSNRTYEGDVIKGVEQTSGGLCIVPNEEKESLDRNHLFVWNTGDFKHFIAHTEPHPSSKDKDSKELQDLINTKLTELGKEPRSIFPHKLRNNSSDRISASFDKSDYEMARDDRFEDIEVHIEQLKAEVDSILLLLKQKEKEEILNEVKDEPNDTNLAIPQELSLAQTRYSTILSSVCGRTSRYKVRIDLKQDLSKNIYQGKRFTVEAQLVDVHSGIPLSNVNHLLLVVSLWTQESTPRRLTTSKKGGNLLVGKAEKQAFEGAACFNHLRIIEASEEYPNGHFILVVATKSRLKRLRLKTTSPGAEETKDENSMVTIPCYAIHPLVIDNIRVVGKM